MFDRLKVDQIVAQLFSLMQMMKVMAEEYKEEFPGDFESDPNTRSALLAGFTSYQSDSVDYFLEHNDEHPLTLLLFYDSNEYDPEVMKMMALRILDIYVLKCDSHLQKGGSLE